MGNNFFEIIDNEDKSHEEIFSECRNVAEILGFDYFGVQYKKECWGSKDANETYSKYGCSTSCELKDGFGIGGDWANFMYHRKKGGLIYPLYCVLFARTS